MTDEERVNIDYLDWMYDLMCEGRFAGSITYRKLFNYLHNTEFIYFIPHDENRAADGIALRRRFCRLYNYEGLEHYLNGPCSVLEMMIALAIRCEEYIMCDPEKGDRTAQWFWSMLRSMGLNSMTDYNFDTDFVSYAVSRFLNREYDRNGKGGLFTIKRWNRDARDAEIWHQLLAYLNTIE